MMSYYTPIGEAACLLRERQEQGIREQVREWLARQGLGFPVLPDVDAMAIFPRHVATARFEDVLFREMALASGLLPVWVEYGDDMFISGSNNKRSLLHPLFCTGRGKAGVISRKERLADVQKSEGKKLRDIRTHEGEELMRYHHALQDRIFGEGSLRGEISGYVRGRASQYYVSCVALYLAHGVLFEDYHAGESGNVLSEFTRTVFEPAFATVLKIFGIKPLIVQMPWWPELALYPSASPWEQYGVVTAEKIAELIR